VPTPDPPTGQQSEADARALLEAIAESKQRTDSNAEKARRSNEQQEADDRSPITWTVTRVLGWGVPLTILMLLALAWLEPASAPEAIKAVVEIFKAVLLPVTTLVLGYYFGRGGKG
jgi:hypothetical protein